jgi:hypothetical protein
MNAARRLGIDTRQRRNAARISRSESMRRNLIWLTISLSGMTVGASQLARAQTDPRSLPAQDSHQSLLVAADPYLSVERYQARFGKKHTPYDAGILALEVYARNDNDKPIRINLDTVTLLIGAPGQPRQKLNALAPEEVADRVLLKTPRDPKRPRLPLPLPGGVPNTGKGKEWQEFATELRAVSLSSDVLPPNATVHGFFYFDIDRHYDWVSNARFELPDLEFMLDKKALLFFEVDLAPSVH